MSLNTDEINYLEADNVLGWKMPKELIRIKNRTLKNIDKVNFKIYNKGIKCKKNINLLVNDTTKIPPSLKDHKNKDGKYYCGIVLDDIAYFNDSAGMSYKKKNKMSKKLIDNYYIDTSIWEVIYNNILKKNKYINKGVK